MIGKLKTVSGYHWTSKLEDMFKDIQLSRELTEEFKKLHGEDLDVELQVSVCTTGSWPSSTMIAVKPPKDIHPVTDRFSQFYLKRYSGRRLNFQFDKGRADVQVFFTSKTKKILTVSTYQMILLSLFNNKDTLTYQEILEQSGIPREECFLQLLSMVHPTVKVLRKAPNTKDVEDDHKFAINPKYTNPRTKVNIPIVTSLRPPNPNAVVEEEKKNPDSAATPNRRGNCAYHEITQNAQTHRASDGSGESIATTLYAFTWRHQETHLQLNRVGLYGAR